MPLRTYVAIYLCRRHEKAVRQFFIDHGILQNAIRRELHVTVYQADCAFPGLASCDEGIQVEANVDETRFMVMAAGGEVRQPHIDPHEKKVGIRFTRRNQATQVIDDTRLRFTKLETPEILGGRKQTTARRSAFGAPNYQPHMTLLNPGSNVGSDLTVLGQAFRSQFEHLVFDRLEIRLREGSRFDDGD